MEKTALWQRESAIFYCLEWRQNDDERQRMRIRMLELGQCEKIAPEQAPMNLLVRMCAFTLTTAQQILCFTSTITAHNSIGSAHDVIGLVSGESCSTTRSVRRSIVCACVPGGLGSATYARAARRNSTHEASSINQN